MTILAWLVGSKLGRMTAGLFLVLAGIGMAVLKAFLAGKSAERARHTKQSLDNLRERIKTDDEISALDPASRRERLGQWASYESHE